MFLALILFAAAVGVVLGVVALRRGSDRAYAAVAIVLGLPALLLGWLIF
jgi:hypothetical protein